MIRPRTAAPAALIVLGLSVTAACSGGGGDQPQQEAATVTTPAPAVSEAEAAQAGVNISAEIDSATGAIVFPYDRFLPTAEEEDILVRASTVALSDCAADQGVDWQPDLAARYSTLYSSSVYFGVWTEDQATRFGFVSPMTNADLVANGLADEDQITLRDGSPEQPDTSAGAATADHNASLSAEDLSVVDACGASERVTRFDRFMQGRGPWAQEMAVVSQEFEGLEAVDEAYDDLDMCLEGRGLEPDPEEPGMPRGWELSITEQQTRLALTVVECKTETDFVPRLAQLMAEQQAPTVVKYANELIEFRQELDQLLADSRTMLSS